MNKHALLVASIVSAFILLVLVSAHYGVLAQDTFSVSTGDEESVDFGEDQFGTTVGGDEFGSQTGDDGPKPYGGPDGDNFIIDVNSITPQADEAAEKMRAAVQAGIDDEGGALPPNVLLIYGHEGNKVGDCYHYFDIALEYLQAAKRDLKSYSFQKSKVDAESERQKSANKGDDPWSKAKREGDARRLKIMQDAADQLLATAKVEFDNAQRFLDGAVRCVSTKGKSPPYVVKPPPGVSPPSQNSSPLPITQWPISIFGNDTPSWPITNPAPDSCPFGMPTASAFTPQAALHITDVPLKYEPPVGETMVFGLSYNATAVGSAKSMPFQSLSTFGRGWSFNWTAYLTRDASNTVTIMVPGGGAEIYRSTAGATTSYAPHPISHAVLTVLGPANYRRQLPDGSVETYSLSDKGGRLYLTSLADPSSNTTHIQYDATFRIASITDALGQISTVRYASGVAGSAGFYKIASITDPFGRSAKFTYDSTQKLLLSVTDQLGLRSQFAYDANSFVTSMTTPYGTTRFSQYIPAGSKAPSAGLRFTYPDGTVAVIESWIAKSRTTYFWDREAMARFPDDPRTRKATNCTVSKWLAEPGGTGTIFPAMHAVKPPLESPTIYAYAGQKSPTLAGVSTLPIRVIRHVGAKLTENLTSVDQSSAAGKDRSVAQKYKYEYNNFGHITKTIDPIGRTFTFKYAANNVDLVEERQSRGTNNDLIGYWQYNDKHLPIAHVDGSGQRSTYQYNRFGELTSTTDANNSTWTWTYDNRGYLRSLRGPIAGMNDLVSFTYDNAGRIASETDANGYTRSYRFDSLDRPIEIKYPDQTSEQFKYDKLDAVLFQDRMGRQSRRSYDEMGQIASETDLLGRTTRYRWCGCGALMNLTDPAGNVTSWQHDLQGRVTRTVYSDKTAVDYLYENPGRRLQSKTDAMHQTTNYTYTLDGMLAKTTYSNSVHHTSEISTTYDSDYPRRSTVRSEQGTVSFQYNPYVVNIAGGATRGGGRLRSISNSSMPNSEMKFSYDAIGSLINRSIEGSNNSITWKLDPLGRVISETSALGTSNYSYEEKGAGADKTGLNLRAVTYPNGQVTKFAYHDNIHDQLLAEIKNLGPKAAILSQFEYAYNPAGEITQWKQQLGSKFGLTQNFSYDAAGQLTVAQSASTAAPLGSLQYSYAYDAAGNRTIATESGGSGAKVNQARYNSVNEMIGLTSGPSTYNLSYDRNGNLISDGVNKYQWDAEDRLIEIDYPGKRNNSRFTFNPLGYCEKIVETRSGSVTETRQLIWFADHCCEIRDGSGLAVLQLFSLGQTVGGVNYFYTVDHLGSTREMTNAAGDVAAQYFYDPYGKATKLQGTLIPDFQYAGYYAHAASGLNLTLTRAYNPEFGRWINRDPIGEEGGVNLFAYVGGNPVNRLDPYGMAEGGAPDMNNYYGGYTRYGKKKPKYEENWSTRVWFPKTADAATYGGHSSWTPYPNHHRISSVNDGIRGNPDWGPDVVSDRFKSFLAKHPDRKFGIIYVCGAASTGLASLVAKDNHIPIVAPIDTVSFGVDKQIVPGGTFAVFRADGSRTPFKSTDFWEAVKYARSLLQ